MSDGFHDSYWIPMYKWGRQRWEWHLDEVVNTRNPKAPFNRATYSQIQYLLNLQVPEFVAKQLSLREADKLIKQRLEEKRRYEAWVS